VRDAIGVGGGGGYHLHTLERKRERGVGVFPALSFFEKEREYLQCIFVYVVLNI
jgi:hypothetical protein